VTSKLSPLWAAENIGDVPQNVNFALKASVVRDFLESRSIEFQSGTRGAPIPLTALPSKVTGAIFPLQCSGSVEANDNRPSAFGGGDALPVEKRPGVLIAGYGSPAGAFHYVFLELQNVLSAFGVVVANRPSATLPVSDDSASIQNLLRVIQTQGSDALLYVTVEHGISNVHRARLQCFDKEGKLLWEERASSTWTWAVSEQGAASAVVKQLQKKLKSHVGKPGLPVR
jgi:hypothetical protein